MNPLTNVKNITKLAEQELTSNRKTSWHDQYRDSAWIFIGGLPYDLTEGDVITIFSQYGEVVNINLIRDKDTGKQKGYGFLCYEDQRSTVLAVDNFNGIKILGRTIRVDHVASYKAPKDSKNTDEETRNLRKEGCAPKAVSYTSAMNRLPMHDALKQIAWLEGTWRTKSPGKGKFPTIKPFNYCEEISFTSIGQPMFNYTAQSWHPEKKTPMHREVGFLKILPGTNKVCLLLSHNFGLTTIEEGEIGDKCITLSTTGILKPTIGTKPPAVTKIQRELKLVGDTLQHILHMATDATPEAAEHLSATYIKQSEEGN